MGKTVVRKPCPKEIEAWLDRDQTLVSHFRVAAETRCDLVPLMASPPRIDVPNRLVSAHISFKPGTIEGRCEASAPIASIHDLSYRARSAPCIPLAPDQPRCVACAAKWLFGCEPRRSRPWRLGAFPWPAQCIRKLRSRAARLNRARNDQGGRLPPPIAL
jgi:hypothetical protein